MLRSHNTVDTYCLHCPTDNVIKMVVTKGKNKSVAVQVRRITGLLQKQNPRKTQIMVTEKLPLVRPPGQGLSKTAKRRRAQRAQLGMDASMTQTSPVGYVPNVISPQQASQVTRAARSYANVVKQAGKVSKDGLAFLKCAFAPADFDGTSVFGVPDDFGGKSLAVRYRNVTSFAFTAGNDYYFILAPVPGVCYWVLSVVAGTALTATNAVFVGTVYSTYSAVFPTNTTQNQLTTKFRFVSNHFELVNTTNNNSWTGSIQSFKIPLQAYQAQEADASVTNAPLYWSVSGLNSCSNTDADMYSGAFNFGLYAGAFNRGAKFDFQTVFRTIASLPGAIGPNDFGQLNGLNAGFDNNFESICIRVTGVTTNQSAMIRSWACVEYQFLPGTVMYESQSLHVDCDRLALEIYKRVSIELGAGVSALDNANFWTRVLDIIASMGLAGAVLPGPYGAISGGVGGIAAAVRQLML